MFFYLTSIKILTAVTLQGKIVVRFGIPLGASPWGSPAGIDPLGGRLGDAQGPPPGGPPAGPPGDPQGGAQRYSIVVPNCILAPGQSFVLCKTVQGQEPPAPLN